MPSFAVRTFGIRTFLRRHNFCQSSWIAASPKFCQENKNRDKSFARTLKRRKKLSTSLLLFQYLRKIQCSNKNAFSNKHIGKHSCFSPSGRGFGSWCSQFFSKHYLILPRFINGALLRELTVQSLIADPTHLVLVSGKLQLNKTLSRQYKP